MVNPLLSRYAMSLGATLTLAGTIVGIQSGMAMLLRPLSGMASDRLNRKHVMIGSILVVSSAYAGYLLFSNLTAVIICRVLQGVAFGFMSVARTAYATEYMPKERVGEGVAFSSFGIILSQALGPAAGLWISDNWGYRACFIIALSFSLTGALLLTTCPHKHRKRLSDKRKAGLNTLLALELLPYAFLAGLFSVITQLGNAFVALIGADREIANIGLFFTTYSIFALILRPLSGRILDRFGLPVQLYPAFIFASITMLLLGSANSIALIILAGVTKVLSQGIALPCIQGASIKRLGKERAGVISATLHMGQDVLNTIAPAFGGLLASSFGYTNMFYIFSVIMLLGIPYYMLIRRKEKRLGIIA